MFFWDPNRRVQAEQRSVLRGAIPKLHQAQIWKWQLFFGETLEFYFFFLRNENLWVFQNLPSRTSRANLLGQQEQIQMLVKRWKYGEELESNLLWKLRRGEEKFMLHYYLLREQSKSIGICSVRIL